MGDRKATEELLLNAADRIIQDRGFSGLGINAIAKEAGVSKVLIYRYFGSYDEFLEAWALKNSYWITFDQGVFQEDNLSAAVNDAVMGLAKGLREQPAKREVLRWLLAEKSKAGREVMDKLEERGLELTRAFAAKNKVSPDLDLEALMAIVTAGVNYLALIGDRAEMYNGIPLEGEEGWERIGSCLAELLGKYES